MDLSFEAQLANLYSSSSQRIRILSEHWVSNQVYCPNCGHLNINRYPNNKPVADFFCASCSEDYELKSQKSLIGRRIVDGAYRTMVECLNGSRNPNFFLLHYDPQTLGVINLLIVPKHFFTAEIIEKRKPLSLSARRAGWIGCNIMLEAIPHAGRIYLVRNRTVHYIPVIPQRTAQFQRGTAAIAFRTLSLVA
jgi:type II restriction enzyme